MGSIHGMLEWAREPSVPLNLPSIAIVALLLAFVLSGFLRSSYNNGPPSLPDTIPFISNTYQYMTDMDNFFSRCSRALRKSNVVGFRLGPMKAYIVNGPQVVQHMFRTPDKLSPDKFTLLIMENFWGATKEDLEKFVSDKSGRLKTPIEGTEDTPEEKRYWTGLHHLYSEYLTRPRYTNMLAESFQRIFSERLEKQPIGKWSTVMVLDFLKRDMGEAAVISLDGPRISELNPGFIKTFWEFDNVAVNLAWGLPNWIYRKPWRIRDRFHAMVAKYLESAWANFDWDGPDADADWEEHFGSPFARELAKWLEKSGLSGQLRTGLTATVIFALNSNTIPTAAWAVMEIVQDPGLFQALRKEVMTAYVKDPASGTRRIDAQKLLSLPLLQSVYTEILRLHMSMNITRGVLQPIVLDGYAIEKGAVLQAPTQIAHHDERVWSVDGHPAAEFWAARHVKEVETTDEKGIVKRAPHFVLAGRPGAFFPYGGGISMCPGRHFAKQEIMMTIGMLVARFDIEFAEWTGHDGSPSDRPPKNDGRFAGAAATPPDRDMRVRWKRLW